MSKYGHRPHNWFEAIVNKLGGEESAERFLRGELAVFSEPARAWREQDGVIYFSVTSDGTTGGGWIGRLEKKSVRIGDCARRVLRSAAFKPTSGVTTEIAVLKGDIFADDCRLTELIHVEAVKRQFEKPNAEVACLIREKFTDNDIEAMGLRAIATVHEPIEGSCGPYRLVAFRSGGGRWLDARNDGPGGRWYRDDGFAFVAAQVS